MHANRWILHDKTTSICMRLKYFNACVSTVVCFGGGHCTLYKKQFCVLDVLFRKLCRSIVTPPSNTDWSFEWHEILHHWNDRARAFTQAAGVKPWSHRGGKHHCKLAMHIANVPEHRWVRKIVAWNPSVRYRSLEGNHTRGITKSTLFFVDTRVGDHGWRRRNSTNNGLHSFQGITISARCEEGLLKTMYTM